MKNMGDVVLERRMENTPLLQKSTSISSGDEDRDSVEHTPPEITVRGVIISIVLSVLFSAANAYLGLFAGMTIGVSIPSAVMTMAMVYPFGGNILEVNAVQTGAASGSSIASGIIYTLPALILLNFWDDIHYWETTAIAILGGVMGVMFSSPLRRALVIDNPLKFPEGFATAEILKLMEVTDDRTTQVVLIGCGALVGFLIKLGQAGFLLWSADFQVETVVGGHYLLYFGVNLSPALMSVGYIVGLATASVMFMGGAINWWIVIPILYATNRSAGSAVELWDTKSRYLGVGAMLIGGLGTIISLLPSLYIGVKSAVNAYKRVRATGLQSVRRTERDLPIHIIGLSFVVIIPGLLTLFLLTTQGHYWVAMLMTVFMTIFGFLFSAVGAYMSGVVGSSNNPISGMTLATIVTSAALMMLFMSTSSDIHDRTKIGPAASILIGAVVCCAAAVSGDNMQDLKSGHLVGATPYKQQIMQLIGVIVPGLLIAPIVDLLISAYGLPTDPTKKQPLQAPQATLMMSVAKSIFQGDLPLDVMGIGMGIAGAIFICDLVLMKMKSKHRLPVLAAALGMYLPFSLSGPIVIGGLIMSASSFVLNKLSVTGSEKEACMRKGLLFAAGLITGEALVGIILAIPLVLTKNAEFMAVFGDFSNVQWPGIIALVMAALSLFGSVVGKTIYEERNYYSVL
eukprot:Phypoly_transcript_04365.p1 GENE.Phypoly_transcript_04365~~Phypoly_transcript_04365.p1  ORF type:complete len:683 (+),score=67.39 Phypoly_transcript_04365:83-2131(+)